METQNREAILKGQKIWGNYMMSLDWHIVGTVVKDGKTFALMHNSYDGKDYAGRNGYAYTL